MDKEVVAKRMKEFSNKATNTVQNATGRVRDEAGKIAGTLKDSKGKIQESAEDLQSKMKAMDIELQNAVDEYNTAFNAMNDKGMSLYLERMRSKDLMYYIEQLINSLANHPKSFDVAINEIKMSRENFESINELAKEQLNIAKKTAVGASTGVASGVAVASVAPTAVMWIATTFGTASTGAAISGLSGAAATNAALAWIGGGALAAGGGGMSAGTAFLALAGPVGWGIAGFSIFASVTLFAKNTMKSNKEKQKEIEKIKINTEAVKESDVKIETMLLKTITFRDSLSDMYSRCMPYYNKSFIDLNDESQNELGALVNNTKSLAMTLGETL